MLEVVNRTHHRGEAQTWIDAFILSDPGAECVTWPFARTAGGYGSVWDSRTKKLSGNAARVIWERVNGPIAPGLMARHTCGKGHLGCVNWAHIEPGTHADNMRDRRMHGRNRGESNAQSKMSEEQARSALERMRDGESGAAIAREYGVDRTAIYQLRRGKTWKHLQ